MSHASGRLGRRGMAGRLWHGQWHEAVAGHGMAWPCLAGQAGSGQLADRQFGGKYKNNISKTSLSLCL